ncbi:MAG: WD40 repeat domain-containing protein [Patescibacteria group bacterium]|jgi:hypothetical protein
MRKKVLLGVVFFASMILAFLGFAKMTLAWTDITGAISGSSVTDLLYASDGSIYASGTYNDGELAKVWRYTNGSWIDITGDIVGSGVQTLIQTSDGSIYAGGQYNLFHARVWKYANGVWTDVTSDISGYIINSLMLASDGSIYAGGTMTENGSDFFARVWKYSNNIWSDITGTLTGTEIYSLKQFFDGSIYAGGYDVDNAKVWKYSDNSWNDISSNLSEGSVYTLAQTKSGLIFAGGNFDLGSGQFGGVYRYDNGMWNNAGLMTNIVGGVYDLQTLGDIVYVGGYEPTDSGHEAKIWTYSNGVWSGDVLGISTDYHTDVRSLLFASDGLYAGGDQASLAKVWTRSYTTEEWRLIEENNLENGDEVTLLPELNTQTISGQDLILNFTKLPNKLTKNSAYYMQWQRFNAYPKKWKNVKKTALKRYWKLTTNLNKYKAKKSSQKFKVKVTFKYTKKLFNALKKKNSLATKSNLTLKYRNKKTSWKTVTSVFTDAKLVKKNKKMIVKYFTHFPKKTNYFAIGLK